MLINFNTNNANQTNTKFQNPAFCGVNTQWLNKLKGDIDCARDLTDSVIFSGISQQDAVDTLEAAKKHYFPKFQNSFDIDIQWVKIFFASKGDKKIS